MSLIRQLSLFGVEATAPEPGDLVGLLIAGGRIGREGEAAQVSIEVNHPWRAAAIVAECARRGLAATSVTTASSAVGVRTAFAAALVPLASGWSQRWPREVRVDARVLRLWAMATGHLESTAYVLGVEDQEAGFLDSIGAGLSRLGLAAQIMTRRDRVTFRIVGRRRMSRLVEMVGDPPKQAPAAIWPS